jgi:hypothetical protein
MSITPKVQWHSMVFVVGLVPNLQPIHHDELLAIQKSGIRPALASRHSKSCHSDLSRPHDRHKMREYAVDYGLASAYKQ